MKNDNNTNSSNQNDSNYTDLYSVLENFADHEPRHISPPSRKKETETDKNTKPTRKPVKNAKKRKKKKSGYKVLIAAVLILLFGSIAIAAMSGILLPPAITTNTSDVSEDAVESSVYEEEPEEESEEESKLSYEPTGEFKVDNSKLTPAVIKSLETDVTAKYIVLYDATSDKIIYQRNGSKKCYPASTTKMLTAIVAAKIIPPETVITVGDEIEMIESDSSTAYLIKGMKLKFEALMDALLLPSGNDAAYTIAVNAAKMYTGNYDMSNEEAVKIFMELENEAAKEIGCKNTHYVTPDGWHNDNHYTNATDLAKIAAYARTIPLVKNSCGKEEVTWDIIKDESDVSTQSSYESSANESSTSESSITESSVTESNTESSEDESKPADEETDDENYNYDDEDGEEDGEEEESEVSIPDEIYWYNSNRILQKGSESYSEYCDGMKTGFTDEAGTSVVASATMNGHTFIAVVMFGESLSKKYEDANILFKEGFKLYGLTYKYGADYNETTE